MKRVLAFLLLIGNAPLSRASDMLVTPAWLKTHLADKNLVLFHVGSAPDFAKEHIQGAQLVSGSDLAIPRDQSPLILQLLPPDALRAKLESLGVSDDARVVVYFAANAVSPATRVYFSLDAAGLGENTSLLDGGLEAWKAAGFAVTSETKTRAPGKITVKPRPDLVASLDDVKANLKSADTRIVDARDPQFYEGLSAGSMPRAGHVPGAASVPFQSLATEDNRMKSAADVAQIFKTAGIKDGASVISYCHIGQQATVVYFNAKRLGLKARVYDGSWDEWSRKDELPVEKSPSK